jgi:hypothetical protein
MEQVALPCPTRSQPPGLACMQPPQLLLLLPEPGPSPVSCCCGACCCHGYCCCRESHSALGRLAPYAWASQPAQLKRSNVIFLSGSACQKHPNMTQVHHVKHAQQERPPTTTRRLLPGSQVVERLSSNAICRGKGQAATIRPALRLLAKPEVAPSKSVRASFSRLWHLLT